MMRKVLGTIAVLALGLGAAQAAPIAVTNGNFEAPYTLTNIDPTHGNWQLGAPGWTASGVNNAAGTLEPNFANAYFETSNNDARVGFVNGGATLSQVLGAVFTAGTTYTLTVDFGDRRTGTADGSFGIFANSVGNVVALQAVTFPGEGNWITQSITFVIDNASALIGANIGIFFNGGAPGTQLTLDNVLLNGVAAEQIVTPIPGAAILFGSGLAALGASRRRRKA